MTPPRPLHLELLEDRVTPATFGFPWPNAAHLTVSFAPDGTLVGNAHSQLFSLFAARNIAANVWQGEILEQFRLPQLALEAYQRALDLDPEDDWGRLCLAELQLHRHNAAAAAAQFEVLCRRLPGNAAVRLGLARSRCQAGQSDEARRLLDALLADHPDEGLILSERGRLALNAGELAEARVASRGSRSGVVTALRWRRFRR